MTITLPIRLVSEANMRDHWGKKAKRVAQQRGLVRLALWHHRHEFGETAVVTLTRIAPRELDKHDNLRAAMKGVVDGVADAFGLPNDRDPRVEWRYAQRRGKVREYGVEINIEAAS